MHLRKDYVFQCRYKIQHDLVARKTNGQTSDSFKWKPLAKITVILQINIYFFKSTL